MPIRSARLSDEMVDRVAQRVQSILLTPGQYLVSGGSQERLDLVAPHRVYVLPFDAISQRNLSLATFSGWQFLVMRGDEVVGTAEVLGDADQSVGMNTGPFAGSIKQAIER